MRYKIIATILAVILMLTNAFPILATQENEDQNADVAWDAGDTVWEVPEEYTDAEVDDDSGEEGLEEYTAIDGDDSLEDNEDGEISLKNDDTESSETESVEESEIKGTEDLVSDDSTTTEDVEGGGGNITDSTEEDTELSTVAELTPEVDGVIIDVHITTEDGTPLSRTDEVKIGEMIHVTVTISGAEASEGQLRYSSWRSYVCRLSNVGTSKTKLEGWIQITENLSLLEWKVTEVTVTCEDGDEISLGENDTLLENLGFTVTDSIAPAITDVRITAEDGTPLSRTDEVEIGDKIHVTVTVSGAEVSGGIIRFNGWRDVPSRISKIESSETELEGWILIDGYFSLNPPCEWSLHVVTVTCKDGKELSLGENDTLLQNPGFTVKDPTAPVLMDVLITKNDVPLSRTDGLKTGDEIHVTVTISGAEVSGGKIALSGWRSVTNRLSNIEDSKTELEVWIPIEGDIKPGEWTVAKITVTCEDGSEISFGASNKLLQNLGFTVLDTPESDTQAPCVGDISLDRQGESVRADDKVMIRATVTDESRIKTVFASFVTVDNVNSERVRMTQVGLSDIYEGMFEITEDTFPGEWVLSGLYAEDYADNSEYKSYDENGHALSDRYYFIVDGKDAYDTPEYSVTLYSLSTDGELVPKDYSVPRRTGLADLNRDYPPEDNSNLNFQGWQPESAEQAAAVNNYGILTDGYAFFAEYDKKLVTFNLCTRDASGTISGQYKMVDMVYAKPGENIKLPTEIEGYNDIIWYNPKTDSAYSNDRITVEDYRIPSPIMTISGSAVCVGDDESPAKPELDQSDDPETSSSDSTSGDNSETSSSAPESGDGSEMSSSDRESGDIYDAWLPDSAQDLSGVSQTASSGITAGRRRTTGNTLASWEVSEAANDSDASSDMEEETIMDEWTAEIVARIIQAAAGGTVIVDMENDTIVPKEILKAAQGRDVNIVLQMNGYTWTINGKNILSPSLKDVNLMIILDTTNIPEDTLTELAGDNPVRQLSLIHEGNFGFSATLTINIGSDYASRRGQLYYHDSSGRMMFIDAGDIGEDGNVSLTFSHASDYAIVIHESLVVMPDEGTVSTKAGALFAIQVACVCGIAACIYMIKKEKKKAKADRRAEEFAA